MEWQDSLVDERPDAEQVTAEEEQSKVRRQLLQDVEQKIEAA